MKIIPEKDIQRATQDALNSVHDIVYYSPQFLFPGVKGPGRGEDCDDWARRAYGSLVDEKDWAARMVRLHAIFIESLFDEKKEVLLFRGMYYSKEKPTRGEQRDVGEHWTYSTDADLSWAQGFGPSASGWEKGFPNEGQPWNVLVVAKVASSSVDWFETLAEHVTGYHASEKEIRVKGAVDILDVRPWEDFYRMNEVHDFLTWAKKNKRFCLEILYGFGRD